MKLLPESCYFLVEVKEDGAHSSGHVSRNWEGGDKTRWV